MLKLFLMVCLFWPLFGLAQNLIRNPGFEEAFTEPRTLVRSGQQFSQSVKYWYTPNEASTDLISPKFEAEIINKIPPKKGKNMVGLLCNSSHWTEYLAIELSEPLNPDKSYYFECWMAIPDGYKEIPRGKQIALNEYFGLYAGGNIHVDRTTPLNYLPQLKADSTFVLSPGKWQKFKGVFKVEKESSFLYFGQFHDPAINSPYTKGYFFADEFWLEPFEDLNGTFEAPQLVENGLNNIYFETDKYDILPQTEKVLQEVLAFMKNNPDLEIEIVGHTDDRGEFYHNMELSHNRAKAVATYLTDKGIESARLQTKGLGDTQPIADNTSALGRQQNRRVEFLVQNDSLKGSITHIEKTAIERIYEGFSTHFSKLKRLNLKPLLDKDWLLAQQYKIQAQEPSDFLTSHNTILLTYPGNQSSIYPLLIELIQSLEVEQLTIYGKFPFSYEKFNQTKGINVQFHSQPLDMTTLTLLHWLKAKQIKLAESSIPDWKINKIKRILNNKREWKAVSPDAHAWASVLEIFQQIKDHNTPKIILNPIHSENQAFEWSAIMKHLAFEDAVQLVVQDETAFASLYQGKPAVLSAPGTHFKLHKLDKNTYLPIFPILVPESHTSAELLTLVQDSRFEKQPINLDKFHLPSGDMFIFLQNSDPATDYPIYYEALSPEKRDFELLLPKGKFKLIMVTPEKRLERNL